MTKNSHEVRDRFPSAAHFILFKLQLGFLLQLILFFSSFSFSDRDFFSVILINTIACLKCHTWQLYETLSNRLGRLRPSEHLPSLWKPFRAEMKLSIIYGHRNTAQSRGRAPCISSSVIFCLHEMNMRFCRVSVKGGFSWSGIGIPKL